jgi:hypothetical protein
MLPGMDVLAELIRLYFARWGFWLLVILAMLIPGIAAGFLTPRLLSLSGLGDTWDAPIKGLCFFGVLALEAVAPIFGGTSRSYERLRWFLAHACWKCGRSQPISRLNDRRTPAGDRQRTCSPATRRGEHR